MEKLLNINTFRNFSLENYYFTDQSIVVAVINYLKSLNKKCEFLGLDLNQNPILTIDDLNYQLNYSNNFTGLVSFDSISFKPIKGNILLDLNSELSNVIFKKLTNQYNE
ncbi:MAG: hypothetical protein ACRCTZ_03560 [Sarcina sp.]